MSEIRQNMATKQWVIIASERAKRPEDFADWSRSRPMADVPVYDPECPFCPGNEEGPEMEVLRLPEGESDWQLRVVKNKYPALNLDGQRVRQFDGVHRRISGVGYHEVVIETREHNTSLATQTIEEVSRTFQAFQMRGKEIALDDRIEHIIYFRNHGPHAGTSLVHPHSQIIGLPVVPFNVRSRMEEAQRYFDDTGICVYCAMLKDEVKSGQRVVVENEDYVAFLPYAALSPFHIWILPKEHQFSYLMVSPRAIDTLAEITRDVLGRLYVGLNDPDYNIVLRSAPAKVWYADYLHWYLSLIPRVTQSAGFELGSGMFINTALPEDSAEFLRSVKT
ncbi:MAG: galactose-1-phosphate uridylyltransferase [Chloroflexota bacterium]|nr:galactose-1-phosphate uridylyltransferase [Chloroflexota bacterium]